MSLNSILVPSAGCLFGVYPSSSCDSATSYATRVHNFETLVGRSPSTNGICDVVSAYHDWNDYATAFPTADERAMSDEGRLLLLHWTPRVFGTNTQYLWADIAAGVYDSSIVIPQARLMRDWGHKFFLAFHNEMNASSSAQGGTYGTDAEYASAAQHLHNVFVAQGATNVIWVFKPSGFSSTISRLSTLYPGDAYVDWIGFDPYGTSGTDDLAHVLDTDYPVINWATVTKTGSHTMPIMFAEWGKKESTTGTTKPQFFDQVRTLLQGNYPQVRAVVYFNGNATTSECLDTTQAAVDAFATLAAASYFNPDVSPAGPPVAQGAFRAAASAAFNNTKTKDLVVPVTVQAGDGMLLWHTCTRTGLRNACEGTNVVAVSVANSGTSGSNPVDAVGTPAPTYSTAQFHSGASSWHPAVTAQSVCQARWDASFAVGTSAPITYYGRKYFRLPALPTNANTRIWQQSVAAGSPNQWGLALDASGNLIVRDIPAAATRLTVSGGALALNTWHRVEWKAVWDGAHTQVDVRLFRGANVDGTTPDQTGSTGNTVVQTAAPGQFQDGIFSTSQTWDYFSDDLHLDVNGWPGPAGTSAVLTDPAGWTLVDSRQNASGAAELNSRLYRKTAAAGDPGATITLTTDVPAHGSILLLAYSGVDQLALVDVDASSVKTSDATTVVTPNVTTLVANDWIVSAAFNRDNPGGLTTAWTLPGGEAQRAATFASGTSDGRVAGVATDDGVSHIVGTYGTKTFTADRTGFLGVGWTVAVLSTAATSSGQSLGFMSQHN